VPKEKILAIKFKSLGDVVICTPALKALKKSFSGSEIHVLVPSEATAILRGIPWIKRVWGMDRSEGSINFGLIRQLRAERFSRSVDFVGNDRGAITSFCVKAPQSLGFEIQRGPKWRRWCYSKTIEELDPNRHEVVRDLHLLKGWDIPFPNDLAPEIYPEKSAIPSPISPESVLIHCTTSQPKKEWPLEFLEQLHTMCNKHNIRHLFSAGPSEREQLLLANLANRIHDLPRLPKLKSLNEFIATAGQCRAFVSMDTSVLHIAAALGKPTIGIFGPTDSHRWGPLGSTNVSLQGGHCPCSGHLSICEHSDPCIRGVSPQSVMDQLLKLPNDA
jgi:heptosyltransferase-3